MIAATLALLGAFGFLPVARAAGGDPVPEPSPSPGAIGRPSAESRYNSGLTLARQHRWNEAEQAFREAIALRREFPEAWNELGHTLRQEKRFPESVAAYQEALRLRPNYAQALEYLGETYLAMGDRDKANATLERLRPLDARLADQLASAIDGHARRVSRW